MGLHFHTLITRRGGWSAIYSPERDPLPMLQKAGWALEAV